METPSWLVSDLVSSSITHSTDSTVSMKWCNLSRQATRHFYFFTANTDSGWNWCVYPHRMAYLYEELKCQRHTSYGGNRSRSHPYNHGYQLLNIFPQCRDNPLCPDSSHPSLQWKALSLIPWLHIFWVCWSLQLSYMPPCSSPPITYSRYWGEDLWDPPSCKFMHPPLWFSSCSNIIPGGYPGGGYQGSTTIHPWIPP